MNVKIGDKVVWSAERVLHGTLLKTTEKGVLVTQSVAGWMDKGYNLVPHSAMIGYGAEGSREASWRETYVLAGTVQTVYPGGVTVSPGGTYVSDEDILAVL